MVLPKAAEMVKDELVRFLLDNDLSSITDQDENDRDVLCHVIHKGYYRFSETIIEFLVSKGADRAKALLDALEDKKYDEINLSVVESFLGPSEITLLKDTMVAAAEYGDLEIFSALLNYGGDFLEKDSEGKTSLEILVREFNAITSRIKYFDGFKLYKGAMSLQQARDGSVHKEKAEKAFKILEITQICLDKILDSERPSVASNLLAIAVKNGKDVPHDFFNMVDLLIEFGADVNSISLGSTILQTSIICGSKGMISHLLEANADPAKKGVGIFDCDLIDLARNMQDEGMVELLAGHPQVDTGDHL